MPEVEVRKRIIVVEEIFHEGGPAARKPLRRAAALAVIRNPFAGRYVEEGKGEVVAKSKRDDEKEDKVVENLMRSIDARRKIGLDRRVRTKRGREDVSRRMRFGLLGADYAAFHPLLDVALIARQLDDDTLPQQIQPGVSDVTVRDVTIF